MTNIQLVDENGTKRWYKDRQLHRDDGPAIIFAAGDMLWYRNGKLHREDGPAIIYSLPGQSLFVQLLPMSPGEGQSYDDVEWWLNGEHYVTFEEYCNALQPTDEDKMLMKIQYSK